MRTEVNATQNTLTGVREPVDLVVAVDVGSARVACAVAELNGDKPPKVLAAESAASFGIRAGEIVDLKRASEAIRIAIAAAADRAEADVKTVVVGLSGDVKLSNAKVGLDLDRERRLVTPNDLNRLRNAISAEPGPGRRIIHRFDGPFSVGDLHGLEQPEGLSGDRLEMHAAFLTAASDRLDNVLRAVRGADVEIEAVALEPMACSLGALTVDERALGAAVLDFGAGAFRGALWEGGRLRQIHVVGKESGPVQSQSGRISGTLAPAGGMDGVTMAIARRFRIAPATAARLLRTHATLDESGLSSLPAAVDVAAVDGLGSVRVETLELSRTLEELLSPAVRSMREGLSGFSNGHAVGVVLTGGSAKIRGMAAWVSKRFGGAPVRVGVPMWRVAEGVEIPAELDGCTACSLSGLLLLGAEGRKGLRYRRVSGYYNRFMDGLRRFVASL